jgi:predicted aspartyl protease
MVFSQVSLGGRQRSPFVSGRIRRLVFAACIGFAFVHGAEAACKIGIVGELTVETARNRVVTAGEIAGQPIKVLIDTGTSFSFIWEDAAQRLHLPVNDMRGVQIYGIGGQARSFQTLVRELRIGTFYAKDLSLVVLGARPGRPSDAPALVVGDDLFSRFSTEFDLAHGKIRLLRTEGCHVDEVPYWSKTYSAGDLARSDDLAPQIRSRVAINGKTIDAVLDTGIRMSAITRRGAERAGVTPWLEGAPSAGKVGGVGRETEESWIGTFESFTIGDETVRNVSLRIADLFRADRAMPTGSHIAHEVEGLPTMLIGCDFFLAHRMVVMSKQHKLVFTYNGGPIFQIDHAEHAASDSATVP